MKRRAFIAVVASVAGLITAPTIATAGASSSDLALFGKDPGKDKAYACYLRRYDAAHLKSHPKQNVGDMTLFVDSSDDADSGRQYSLTIGVHFRKKATLFEAYGGCRPSADGKSALTCGIDCDGGRIDVEVKDADSILVAIPDGARTSDPNGDDAPPNARFGADDKLFRLDRAKLQDCLPVISDDDVKADLAKQQ